MRVKLARCFAAVVVLLTANIGSSLGAEVSIGPNPWSGDPMVVISGNIESGDLAKIKKISLKLISSLNEFSNTPLQFHLNTPGGDIEEAIKIGRFAREILVEIDSFGTIIIAPGSEEEKSHIEIERRNQWKNRDYVILPSGAPLTEKHIVRNYSAGVLIFYGATKRYHRDNSDWRLGFNQKKSIPVIGIHRPYYEGKFFSELSPQQAAQAYKNLETLVRDYLAEMGAPQELIDRMFNKASNDMDLLTEEEFRRYYKSEESFLEEWLIAKCGTTGHQNVLVGDELKNFAQIQANQVRSRMHDKNASDKPILYQYPNKNFSHKYVEDVYNKLRIYNRSVNYCRTKIVSLHQREWAKKYKK